MARNSVDLINKTSNSLFDFSDYWRDYVTFFSLANEYGVAESTAHDITVWVENVLIKSGKFGLPGKKLLIGDGL